MSTHRSVLVATSLSDEPRAYLGGTEEDIPIVEFTADFYVQLAVMSPTEQAAWLRRLALAAEELAEQIEPSDSPIALVPLVRFDGDGGAA